MPDLPKSVVGRLKAQPAPQEHPDANLLAAFAEQALTGRERQSVLAHLAACGSCREIVALAAPQAPALQPVGVFVPWYRRPQTFAWAGTLATLALVSAIILNYGRSPRDASLVDDTGAKISASNGALKQEVPAQQPQSSPAASVEAGKRAEPPRRDLLAKTDREQKKNKAEEQSAVAAKPSAPAAVQAPAKDAHNLDGGVLQGQYSAMNQAAVPAPPPAAARVAESAPRPSAATNEKQQAAAEADAVTESAAGPQGAMRAKGADLAIGGGTAGTLYQSKAAKMAVTPPRWSVTDKGRLQRSLDSGRTWQPQLAKESTLFRAVAVVGSNVWAGGSGAALFHSADGGSTWTRQVLPGSSADIVSLQFNDAQHGTAKTADGLVWTTADGGQRWAKQ